MNQIIGTLKKNLRRKKHLKFQNPTSPHIKALYRTLYIQVGIVSLGRGCADSRYAGMYTRVTAILDLIKKTTANTTVWDSACKKL